MSRTTKSLLAHELGHAIFSYLYDTDAYPTCLKLTPTEDTLGYVEFNAGEGLPCADQHIGRIPSNSYFGGMFGEMLHSGRFRTLGVRNDIDDLLSALRYTKNGKPNGKQSYRRSKSAIFRELWAWFYTDHDRLSYGGMMKRWMDCPRGVDGTYMTEKQFAKRLPVTAKIFEKFISHIDPEEYNAVVEEMYESRKQVFRSATLRKYGRRIILDTAMHPGDI